jgi:hypothetical protein
MGDNASVLIANLFLHYILDLPLRRECTNIISLYKRFIDDIIVLTNNPQMVITKIRNLLKVVGISLNEDIQTSFYAVNFLDIYIFKKENRLMTSL